METLQAKMMGYLDRVLLPSEVATDRFTQRYDQSGVETCYAPILLDDRSNRRLPGEDRKYFAKIGMVNRATGHQDGDRVEVREAVARDGTVPDDVRIDAEPSRSVPK